MELRAEVLVRPRQLGQARRQAGKNRGRHGTVIPYASDTTFPIRVISLVSPGFSAGQLGEYTISEEMHLNVPHLRVHTITLHVARLHLHSRAGGVL
jgi:hypothetical protein